MAYFKRIRRCVGVHRPNVQSNEHFNAVVQLFASGLVGVHHLALHRVQPEKRRGVFHHLLIETNFSLGAGALRDVPKVHYQPDQLATGYQRGNGALKDTAILHFDFIERRAVKTLPQFAGTL